MAKRNFFLVFVLAVLLVGPARADLLSHWPLNGDLDDIVGGNDGEFFGDIEAEYTEGYDGTEDGAVLLDGVDDYIKVTYSQGLPLYDYEAFSVAMWVKGLPQPDNRIFAESSSQSGTPLYTLGTDRAGTTGVVDMYVRGDNGQAAVNHWQTTREAFDDEWHHVALVDDNGNVTIYVDGRPYKFTYVRPALTADTTVFGAVIRENHSLPECCFFAGALDDIRIYDHALTEEEVFALLPEPPECPDEGDTHCDGLEIAGPPGGGPGLYSVSVADATDDSDDSIYYTFRADNGAGTVFEVGPQLDINFVDFTLTEGTWTISCTVDDDLDCPDVADDATCEETVEVTCPSEGDTHCGSIQIEGPPGNIPGNYVVTSVDSKDDSGDEVIYTFTADNGEGTVFTKGPRTAGNSLEPNKVTFTLGPGTWTISVAVDDDPTCDDEAPDAVCSQQITVTAAAKEFVSHWKFDGDTVDSRPSGNDGSFQGDLEPTFVEGFDGTDPGAISLDGIDDYVEVFQEKGLPIAANEAFSICMWVKGQPVNQNGAADCRIFSEASTLPTEQNPLFNLGTHSQGADGSLDVFIRTDNGQLAAGHWRSQREVFDDTWHHVAWVDDGGKVTLYIDGVPDARKNGRPFDYVRGQMTLDTTSIGSIVRGDPTGPTHFFWGAIDDVRVYNYALSKEEVEALVPEPEGCPDAGDTHCGGIQIDGPEDNLLGFYTVTATGAGDDSGDEILYTFTAEGENGEYLQFGPAPSDTAQFFLMPGQWTIKVRVDDDIRCRDEAADAVCTQVLTVETEDEILLSHWKLDGDLVDSGTGGNDGDFLGGDPTFTEGHDGTPNGAVQFDGVDDLISAQQNDGLPITGHAIFTIAMWVKGPPGQRDMRVFSEASTLSNTPLYNIGTNWQAQGGTVDIYIRSDTNQIVVAHRNSQGVAFDDTWHHIAWVDYYGQATLYIDGEPDPTNFNYVRPSLTMDTTTIGGILRAAPSHYFTGAIDDVRIYTYALSREEIQELIGGAPPVESFSRGDANDDGNRNIADAIFVLGYLFGGGPEPTCPDAADANDDGNLNIADAIAVLGHLFGGTGPLPAPFPDCGSDPSEDGMGKCVYTHCP